MPKTKKVSSTMPPARPRSQGWGGISFALHIEIEPSKLELAQALRGPDEIPRIARDYIASLLEGNPRGRPRLSEQQKFLRRATVQLTYLTAQQQIIQEDAKAKPANMGRRQRRPAQAERILERTSHLLATKEKINLGTSAIKDFVYGREDEFEALFEDHSD